MTTLITSPADLSSFLREARGETIRIRHAHGPGLFKLNFCGALYDSALQPVKMQGKATPLHRYVVQVGRSAQMSVEFCVGDIESICVGENTIYLKCRA